MEKTKHMILLLCRTGAVPLAAAVFLLFFLVPCQAGTPGEKQVTPDTIRALTASFTLDSVPALLSALNSSDPRCREEALITLQKIPQLPPWEEAPLIEAAIDGLGDASDTVRFQALKVLAARFPDRQRTREAISAVATASMPMDLLKWARDEVFSGGRQGAEAREQLKRIASEADARLREYLREQPLFESASRTRSWLLKDPLIQAVELSRDGLWFTTRDGLESGLLLDAYRALATQSGSASAATSTAHFPGRRD